MYTISCKASYDCSNDRACEYIHLVYESFARTVIVVTVTVTVTVIVTVVDCSLTSD